MQLAICTSVAKRTQPTGAGRNTCTCAYKNISPFSQFITSLKLAGAKPEQKGLP